MRRLVFLLAFSFVVPCVSAVLAGCGSPAPTERVAAPANTAAVLQEPTSASTNADSTNADRPATSGVAVTPTGTATTSTNAAISLPAPTPTPVPTTDDGLEFESSDPRVSSGRDGGISGVDKESPENGGSSAGPVQGQSYTWEDGDRSLTVYLQTDLAVEESSDGLPRDVVASDASVARGAQGQSNSDALPVFRSEYGELMSLPGGVLLVLNSEWSEVETDAFFSTNGIKMDRVSELSYAANGFFIETEPGFPSLELANALAILDGVEVSSPNWAREEVPK